MKLFKAFIISAFFTNSIYAGIVNFNHTGSSDPTSEGWVGGTTGVVGPVNDGGVDAWSINDNTTTAGSGYSAALTAADFAILNTEGWTMSANMRMVSGIAGGKSPFLMSFRNGTRSYDFLWGLDSNNNQYVQASTGRNLSFFTSFSGPLLTLSSGYHQFDMVYDPLSTTVDVFVDDIEVFSNVSGWSLAQSVMLWGGGGSQPTGQANFASVGFQSNEAAVPEASTCALVLTGLIGLGVVRRKRTRQ